PPHEPPKPLKHLVLVCGLRRFYSRFISERAIVGKTSLRSLDDGSIRHHAAMTHRTRKDSQLNLAFLSYHVAHEWKDAVLCYGDSVLGIPGGVSHSGVQRSGRFKLYWRVKDQLSGLDPVFFGLQRRWVEF